jgi:hypothetical protein
LKRIRTYVIEDCYLSDEAREMVKAYQDIGVRDPDLALELTLKTLPEERVFELPEREDGPPGE